MKPWRTIGGAWASGTVTMMLIVMAAAPSCCSATVNRHYCARLPPGRDRIMVRRRGMPGAGAAWSPAATGPGRAGYAVATRNRVDGGGLLATPAVDRADRAGRWLLDPRPEPRVGRARRGRAAKAAG